MYATGKVQQVAKEMNNYKIDPLDVSECRWTGSGKPRLNSGETVLCSGTENAHEKGVAIIIAIKHEKSRT